LLGATINAIAALLMNPINETTLTFRTVMELRWMTLATSLPADGAIGGRADGEIVSPFGGLHWRLSCWSLWPWSYFC